ncbi:hypothetical protein BsIDN1_18560 [Bacillus safensis]|uniref:YtxH domain-containing protein n=1 Tax=Bacillus safensis TaxID=561879 RepID=A0A5S9M5Y9_BACIA|nr:hypothetical protein BsIDN1_18560 [Bacillus safensis]
MASGRSLLTGLFVGGLLGGAAVLLTTPSSGRDVRGKVKDGYDKIRRYADKIKKRRTSFKKSKLWKQQKKAQR